MIGVGDADMNSRARCGAFDFKQIGWVIAPAISYSPNLPSRHLPGQILRHQPAPHVAVERRQRPVPHRADQPVLHRIEPAIFHMPPPVVGVADHVLQLCR